MYHTSLFSHQCQHAKQSSPCFPFCRPFRHLATYSGFRYPAHSLHLSAVLKIRKIVQFLLSSNIIYFFNFTLILVKFIYEKFESKSKIKSTRNSSPININPVNTHFKKKKPTKTHFQIFFKVEIKIFFLFSNFLVFQEYLSNVNECSHVSSFLLHSVLFLDFR